MTPNEEKELRALSRCLAQIERQGAFTPRVKEAIKKAGIALGLVFVHKLKGKWDEHYSFLNKMDKSVAARKKQARK